MINSRKLPNKEALSIIEESIKQGSSVKMIVKGNSMSPLLIDGKDTVLLEPSNPESLHVEDIIFFRYHGSFLLHRIVAIDKDQGLIITKGDAILKKEEISFQDVLARAKVTKINFLRLYMRRFYIRLCNFTALLRKF